jgi:hypothetical protein
MNVLLRLRALAQKQFLIQMRVSGGSAASGKSASQRVYQHAAAGTIADFYREELAERERLRYPPAATLIKITVRGEKTEVEQDMADLARHLAEFKPLIFPAFGSESPRGQSTSHALIKLARGQWSPFGTSPTGAIGRRLATELAALPVRYGVMIDPESLL